MGPYTLIPHFTFEYYKQGYEYLDEINNAWVTGGSVETKETNFDVGLGLNYEADEDVILVGDIGFWLNNFETTYKDVDPVDTTWKNKDKMMYLPYFRLGIDADVFKWMDFRAGVVKQWQKSTYDPFGDSKVSWSWAETMTYLGAGFNWGNFTIDAAINTDFLENGPYFISGENDYLTEMVSLKYKF